MKHHPFIGVDGDMVDDAVPEFFVEGYGQGIQFTQFKHHASNGDGVHLHFVPLFLQRRQLGFGFFKAAAQFGVGGTVGFFGHGVGGVSCDTQAQHLGDGGQFLFQNLNIRINEVRVREHPLGIAELVDGGIPVGKILPKGDQVQFLHPVLGQMGCFAFAFPFEFAVALPDNTAVAVGGVPGFGTENITAVGADDLPGEGAGLMVTVAAVFAPFQFHLNLFPFPGFDDGRVAVLHIVLGNLPLIDLGFLGEEIHRERLLKQSGALVLFVPQDALHGGSLPDGLFSGGRDALLRQHGGNGIGGFPLEELAVDAFDDLRFLRDDLRQSVGTSAVTQELAVGDADFTVGEPFPLSPSDILGNGAAFLLSQTGHDGDEQFPLGVEGHDVFFLEEALTASLLQLADGGQTVYGVSGETAYTLGHNQVDLSGQSIPDHAVEAVPALGIDGADALIGVDLHEVPVGVLLNEPGVVIHLGFIGGELLFAVRGDTGVSGYPAANPLLGRCFGMDIQCGGDDGDIFSFRHGAASFPVFSLRRPGAFPLSNSRHGSGPATALRRWFRP